jgi:hypothetical protein
MAVYVHGCRDMDVLKSTEKYALRLTVWMEEQGEMGGAIKTNKK